MSYSATIRIRKDYRYQGKIMSCRLDGTASLYLQVIIEGVAKRLPLDLSWPPELFNDMEGLVRHSPVAANPLHQDAQRAQDVNLLLRAALTDANNIFTEYRLRRMPVTMEVFLREFKALISKEDFVLYYTAKLQGRLDSHEIAQETWKCQRTSLRTLAGFSKSQPFATMLERGFAKKFDAYLCNKGFAATTRWGLHKDMKTYLQLARKEDNIWFPDPYAGFVNFRPKKGSWEPLMKRDLQLLDAYYHVLEKTSPRRPVLRRWLFALASCGMRISDQLRIQDDWRMFDVLSYIPYKNRKSGRKIMVKLSRRAQELWDDAVREADSAPPYVFTRMSGQKANDYMADIQADLGLKLPLNNHIARHTFATQYLDEGGRLEVLQKMMGHSNISTTMIYVGTTQEAHAKAAALVDSMFGERNDPEPAPETPVRRMRPRNW